MSEENNENSGKRSRSRSNDRSSSKKSKTRLQARILIRSKDAGAVIGRGGENVRNLREQYNGSITVTDSRTPERLVIMHADENSLLGMFMEIYNSIQKNQKGNRGDEAKQEGKLLIHQSHAGIIIGKGGSNLKELRQEYSVDLKVFPCCAPRSTERIVVAHGSPEDVSKVLVHIVSTLEAWPCRGPVEVYDAINYDEYAIDDYGGYQDDDNRGGKRGGGGSAGKRNDSFRSRSPKRNSGYGRRNDDDFDDYNSGTRDVGNISSLLNQLKSTQKVSIPAELAGVIIGKSGTNINRIRSDSGAEIDVEDSNSGSGPDRIITITGTPTQIADAQYLLQQSVKKHLMRNNK